MESTPLNTNTRILRVNEKGFFVANAAVCNSCGVRSLCKPADPPEVCADFSPLFVFRSPLIGFDHEFNTFRLGRGMFDRFRAKLGTVATLYEKRRGRVIGYAKICQVSTGTKEQMLHAYAAGNHLCIGRGIDKDDAPFWLRNVLNKNYKTMFKTADQNDPFTVIHMRRCEAPSFAEREVA